MLHLKHLSSNSNETWHITSLRCFSYVYQVSSIFVNCFINYKGLKKLSLKQLYLRFYTAVFDTLFTVMLRNLCSIHTQNFTKIQPQMYKIEQIYQWGLHLNLDSKFKLRALTHRNRSPVWPLFMF